MMILYLVCLKTNRIKTTICLFYRELWAILFVSSCHELQKVGAPCQMSINMLITEFKNKLADMVTFGQIQASQSKRVCLLTDPSFIFHQTNMRVVSLISSSVI